MFSECLLGVRHCCRHFTCINSFNPRSSATKQLTIYSQFKIFWGFPGGAVVKNLPANEGDTGLSPGLGRSHMARSN